MALPLFLPALALAAQAAPFGNPLPPGGSAQLYLHGTTAVEPLGLRNCEGDRCLAVDRSSLLGLRVGWAPTGWLSAWASLDGARELLQGTDFSGSPLGLGVGLDASLPTGTWRPALLFRASAPLPAGETDPSLSGLGLEGALVLAGGDIAGGTGCWAGATATILGARTYTSEADAVSFDLAPALPAGLLAGAEASSQPLGLPWRRSPRLLLGAELRGLDTWSATAWLGVSY